MSANVLNLEPILFDFLRIKCIIWKIDSKPGWDTAEERVK